MERRIINNKGISDTVFSGIVLVGIFAIIIGIPCLGIAMLGYKLLDKIGHYPSKTPAIQLSILVKLIIIEVVAFTMLILFYHALSDYGR